MQKTIEISMTLSAPLSKVWEALTNPEIIKQYFFGTHVRTTWKVGSPIYFQGEYQGTCYEDKGEMIQFIPEKNITYSYWSVFSGLPDKAESYQIITYTLSSSKKETTVHIKQENLKEDTQSHKDHVKENWHFVLSGLKKIVE